MNPLIDKYLTEGCYRCKWGGLPECKVHLWTEELALLRKIILSCGLTEELKWSMPCYTYNGKNILLLAAFKNYCSISFWKGSLLVDAENVLEKAGENSEITRLFKFTHVEKIHELENHIREYIFEAIELEKSGTKVEKKSVDSYQIPEEFNQILQKNALLKKAFEALTPGRRRAYLMHFAQAKQSKTRITRIEKWIPTILQGKGMMD